MSKELPKENHGKKEKKKREKEKEGKQDKDSTQMTLGMFSPGDDEAW